MLNQIAAIHGTGVAASTTSYESIATTTVGAGGSGTITFSSIPSTYKHLQLRVIARQNTGGGVTDSYITLRFNSDSGTNYAYHQLNGDGATASAGAGTSTTSANALVVIGSGATASAFSAGILDILDYQNTSKFKTLRALTGSNQNSSVTGYNNIYLNSALWQSTSAITSMTLTVGNSFAQHSQFALYGIKG